MLLQILRQKITDLALYQLETAVRHFWQIRSKCKRKAPATAELLQWVAVLERLQQSGKFTLDKLENIPELSAAEQEELQASYGLLVKDKEDMKIVLKDILEIEI